MGYKIFYSYQSDIDSNLNKKFIRTAINNAIGKITQYQVEPLVEGFYGIGGNPPLLEKMLEQSASADIFIGDVTFTMSKIWHTPIGFHEDSHSYLIEIPKGDLKPAPNPNVLLEVGYSWALKQFERTILVMNSAFSDPSKLPVDMKGLRFPITYNLDSARASLPNKYNKELVNLTESLFHGIMDAIKSDIAYQLKIFSPFENHNRWSRLHTYPFLLTPNLKVKLIELRKNINNYKNPVRITGFEGTGKSRLVFEIFQKNDDLDYDEANETILYYDLVGTSFNDINAAVSHLISQNQSKIVIVDNCPLDIHKKLTFQFKGTNVKLITLNKVSSNVNTDNATIFIDEDISKEINQKIIEEKFKSIGKFVDFDISTLKLENTITILENNLENEIENKTSVELLKIIIDEKNAFELMQVVNLFGHIGISARHNKEIETINSVFFSTIDNEKINEVIQSLVSKKLLSQKGDFLTSKGFEDELIENWWEINKTFLNEIIEKLEGTGLLNKFISRLLEVLTNENLDELKGQLFNEKSILINNDFTNTIEGSELLNKLTNDFPVEVLNVLIRKFES